MVDMKSGLRSIADREQWAAHGASFVAKAKATKVVWFPPKPVETGKKTASTAKKATKSSAKRSAKKTSGAAKRTSGAAKGTTTKSAKKVTSPVRRKKT